MEQITQLYKQGQSLATIAKKIGCSQSKVRDDLLKRGIKLRKNWEYLIIPGLPIERIKKDYLADVQIKEIAKRYNVNSRTIVRRLKWARVYKVERSTNTLSFFETFFDDNEVKDLELVRTDAHGVSFSRKIYQGCEVISISEPAYDAASPDYAKITVVVAPTDIIKI